MRNMLSLQRIASCALLLAVAACGKTPAGTRAAPEHDVLTQDEIKTSTASTGDLFQAIQSLRPNFLMAHPSAHSRQSAAALPLAVYVAGIRQSGGIEALKSINAANVSMVRYLDPT